MHQPHIEAHFVPFHDRALDLEEGQADGGVPGLGLLEHKVVDLVADLSENSKWKRLNRERMDANMDMVCSGMRDKVRQRQTAPIISSL